MEDARRDELRRLALWLARRREVDDAVARLTAYGPAAGERVSAHLDALTTLLAAEHEAFAAVAAHAPDVPQCALPAGDVALDTGATVHSLGDARSRRLS